MFSMNIGLSIMKQRNVVGYGQVLLEIVQIVTQLKNYCSSGYRWFENLKKSMEIQNRRKIDPMDYGIKSAVAPPGPLTATNLVGWVCEVEVDVVGEGCELCCCCSGGTTFCDCC
uniref:Uncharacterized protein n=1 Tax=Romanomermis culicivorax TaxID=13658 RepID=A0A915LDA6_ROMCU